MIELSYMMDEMWYSIVLPWEDLCVCVCVGGGGGGGLSLSTWLATHPCPKKVSKLCVFSQTYGIFDIIPEGVFFVCFLSHFTGNTQPKNVRSIYSKGHLGYRTQHHLGSSLEVGGHGWVAHLWVSNPPPPGGDCFSCSWLFFIPGHVSM